MAAATTPQIGQYYPSLKPLLAEIESMVPPGSSTNEQQGYAINEIVNQYTSESPEFKQKLASSLEQQVDKYVDLSHRLTDYNEIYNANSYIAQELGREESGLKDTTTRLKNTIYISKQKSQFYEYQKNKLSFYKGLFLVSCFIIVDVLTVTGSHMSGLISSESLYTITAVSVVIYLFVVYFLIYWNSTRTNTDWNKFNWGSVGTKNSSCPPSV